MKLYNQIAECSKPKDCTRSFTPGPWRVEDDVAGRHIMGNSENDYEDCVAKLNDFRTDIDTANARLIAAAPELLKALEDMILFVASSASVTHPDLNLKEDKVVQFALSVIAKAKGVE